MEAPFHYGYLSDGTAVTLATFADNGAWVDYVANCLRLELFTSKTNITSTTRANLLYDAMIDPYLVLEHTAEAAATGEDIKPLTSKQISRTISLLSKEKMLRPAAKAVSEFTAKEAL